MFNSTHTKTLESKNSNAKLTEIENGSTMPPPTHGHAHSKDMTEQWDQHDRLVVSYYLGSSVQFQLFIE